MPCCIAVLAALCAPASWGQTPGRPIRMIVPAQVLAALNQQTVAALNHPQTRERLIALGLEPAPATPAQYKALLESEVKAYARLVELTGIKTESW